MNDPHETQATKRTQPLLLEEEPERPKLQWSRISTLLLWVLVLTSLTLNIIVIQQLLEARKLARQAIEDTILVLRNFEERQFEYTFVVDDTIIVDTDLPINETLPITIDEDLPINTTVQVPVTVPLVGRTVLDIPINTVIPIELEFDVIIDQTFAINTAVPIYLEQPVSIAVEETLLSDSIDEAQERLELLADELSEPIIALPGGGGPDDTEEPE